MDLVGPNSPVSTRDIPLIGSLWRGAPRYGGMFWIRKEHQAAREPWEASLMWRPSFWLSAPHTICLVGSLEAMAGPVLKTELLHISLWEKTWTEGISVHSPYLLQSTS